MSLQLPETVLEDIFNYYAPYDPFVDEDEVPGFQHSDRFMSGSHVKTLLACLLTCKSWSLVAVRVLYRTVRINSPYNLERFIEVLEDAPAKYYDYGSFVKKLELHSEKRWMLQHPKDTVKRNIRELRSYSSTFFTIAANCENVHQLRACSVGSLSIDSLCNLVRRCPLRYLDLCRSGFYDENLRTKMMTLEHRPVSLYEVILKERPGINLVGLTEKLLRCASQSEVIRQYLSTLKESREDIRDWRNGDPKEALELMPSVTDAYIMIDGRHVRNIESIPVDLQFMQKMIGAWGTNLVILNLWGAILTVDDDLMALIGGKCRQLRFLVFSRSHNTSQSIYTSAGLGCLESLALLQGFTLEMSKTTTTADLQSLWNAIPGIQKLCLYRDPYGYPVPECRLPLNIEKLEVRSRLSTKTLDALLRPVMCQLTHLILPDVSLVLADLVRVLIASTAEESDASQSDKVTILGQLVHFELSSVGMINQPMDELLSCFLPVQQTKDGMTSKQARFPHLVYFSLRLTHCSVLPETAAQFVSSGIHTRLRHVDLRVDSPQTEHYIKACDYLAERSQAPEEYALEELGWTMVANLDLDKLLKWYPNLQTLNGVRDFKTPKYDKQKYHVVLGP